MDENYYENLPKKRMGAGALIFNEKGWLLILKPTYKDHWTIPGGVVDKNESPRKACIREIKEEIGLDKKELRFLCVDYYGNPVNQKGESLQFLFYGGVLNDEEIKNIKTPPEEIGDYKFIDVSEVGLFNKGLSARIPKALEAIKSNTAFYLEDGVKL